MWNRKVVLVILGLVMIQNVSAAEYSIKNNNGDCNFRSQTENFGFRSGENELRIEYRVDIGGFWEGPEAYVYEDGNKIEEIKFPRSFNGNFDGVKTRTYNFNGDVSVEYAVDPSRFCGNFDHDFTRLYIDSSSMTSSNSPPNNPSSLDPSGSGVDLNPNINAFFTDPDGNSGTLYFEDGSGNDISSCGVSDSSGCSVSYNSVNNWGTSYSFQVYAQDSNGATSGTVSQSFTTNYRPSVSNLRVVGSPPSLNPTLKADVSDNDGECMTVTFRDADDGSTVGTNNVCGSGTATTGSSGDDLGSSPGTSYSFDVVVDDGQVSTTSGDQSFTTVHEPNSPSNPNPNNELDVGLGSALPIGEAGRVSGLGGTAFDSATFNRGFDQTPHVFATTQTTNGGQDPSEAHIRNVNTGSFETQHCEFENTDSCNGHADEVNGFFAVNPNNAEDTPGWDSGIVNVDSGSGSYPVNYNMGTQPLLFASPQTDNGEPSLNTRFSSVSSNSANLYFCEQNGQDSCDSSHANEDVAWLALDPSEVSERDGFEYGTFTMSGSSFQSVNFDQNFESPPVVIADVQTRNDGEDAVYAEVNNVGSGGADVRFCESDAGNGCDTHGTEEVAWMAIEPTALSVDVSHPDNLDMNVQFTMDGSNVGSETVNGGSGTASVSPSLGYSEDRSWSVDIDTQGYSTSTSGGTYTFETVHDVYTQSISGPSKSPASIDSTLEATVSHSDRDETVTVDFVNADTGNTINGCSISGIGNSDTATCDTSGASFGSSPGTTYNWRVETSGGQPSESFTSSQLSFTTISKPDSPSLVNPSPSGTSGVDTANNLRVDVTHPDNENMDVTFRVDENADGNYDQSITKTGIASGNTASANPSLAAGTTYDWYAEVDTADYTTSNSNAANPYSFTTNFVPSVDSVSATNSSSSHAFSSVYGIVSDPNGASDISSATLTVDDGDGNTNSYSSTSIDTSAGTGNEANVTFGSVSYTDVAGWSGNENMQLKIQTTDDDGRTALNDVFRRFPNHAPVVETGFSYTDDPNNHAFTLSIEASDVDAGSSEIASCNVEHSDGTNSFSTSGTLLQGEPRSTCKLRIEASTFTGYQKGDVISHNVTFTDQHDKSVTSSTDTHVIPNTAPTASSLEPSGSGVEYGPTIKATYNDADGDTGSITFYNSSSGAQIGSTQTGLSPGEVASVQWDAADSPGTTYSFTVEASDGTDTSSSVVGTYEGDNIDTATVNGKTVTYQRDKYGTWVAVLNYEHFGGENPSVAPGNTFPQFPNRLTTEQNVNAIGTSGETRHVDQISQYGDWDVSAVRLDGYTDSHDREVHFFSTNQNVIDAVTGTAVPSYTDFQGSTTTLYSDHTANLPGAATSTTSSDTNHIFGNEFPFYQGGDYHWALAGQGDRWEIDGFQGDESKTTVHRAWVRVPNSTINEYTENFTTIFQPKKPFDPFPANNSLVDTTNALNSDVAASVKVVHPDGRDMDVQFINASSGNVIDTDFGVPSGGRAKIDNDQTSLRDETNTTYKWFARSTDPGTTPPQRKLSSIYNFSTVEVGTIDFDFQTGKNENVDITGNADNGNEEIRIGVESTILDVIPRILITDSSGNLIKRFTGVSNNSVISVDVVQDGGQDWNLQTDQAYEWSIAAYEQPNRVNKIRERGPFDLYTYNISTSWDRSTKYYNVFEYDLYRAPVVGGSADSYEQVGVTADTSFIDAGPDLEPGEFRWKVAASNPQGESQRIPSGGVRGELN